MEREVKRLKELDKEIQRLWQISNLLSWDQQTCLPEGGSSSRAEQFSVLAGITHEKLIAPEIGDLFQALGISEENFSAAGGLDISEPDRAFLREFYKKYRQEIKLPKKLVTELSEQIGLANQKWAEAKKASDFSLFCHALQKVVRLTVEKANCLGYGENIYDALLDEFEPGMKTSQVEAVLTRLEKRLKNFVQRILNSGRKINDDFLTGNFPVEKQREFALLALRAMGFDFHRGRLDVSVHPATFTTGNAETRLTTKYAPDSLESVSAALHEGGHALYEGGFSPDIQGTILAARLSMGIHESQSRLWENMVGKSLPFWKNFFPILRGMFPGEFQGIETEDFYAGMNKVKNSFIRVESDEVTYNLHIILRFKLEKMLVNGELAVQDLPAAWKEESKKLFGIAPDKDADGVLQDVHWSAGYFGYFPTYALGNLYSAQFYAAIKRAVPGLDKEMSGGNLKPILDWLRRNVHAYGGIFPAEELCRRATGETLNPDHFMDYLEEKYDCIYDLPSKRA